MPNRVLDAWLSRLNAQDRRFDRGTTAAHLWVASIDENKNSHRKITMTHTQTTQINRIALRADKKRARPADVGALISVFEKSATKLKQQKLLKCKQTTQIATFNVRTLNRICDGKLTKFPQILKILTIQDDLNNAVVLDALHSFSYLQVLQFLNQSFGDCTDCAICIRYQRCYRLP